MNDPKARKLLVESLQNAKARIKIAEDLLRSTLFDLSSRTSPELIRKIEEFLLDI